MTTFIGIDPGTRDNTGIAVLRKSSIETATYTLGDDTPASAILADMGIMPDEECIVGIETQYMARGAKCNPATVIKLAHQAGRWLECAAMMEWHAVLVAPRSWQTQTVGINARSGRADVARETKVWAGKVAGRLLPEDEAAALAIAMWAKHNWASAE